MKNMTNLFYNGFVSVSIKINDKLINLSNHNSGLPTLNRSFCNFITGNTTTIEDIPEYIDLRYNNGESWESILISRIHLSGKSWTYDSSLQNYVAKFTGVISYNYLSRLISRTDTSLYRLYLYSGSLGLDSLGNPTGYYDLAYLDIDAETLSYLSPGTQAIIEWSMQLLNFNDDN